MPKLRNILIFVIIALIFFLVYIYFIKPTDDQAGLVSSGAGATLPNIDGTTTNANTLANSLITKDFLNLLSNVKNIKLDDSIFSDPAFNSLRDSSITLTPDGNEGRPNPFAQFGNDLPTAVPTLPGLELNAPVSAPATSTTGSLTSPATSGTGMPPPPALPPIPAKKTTPSKP
jgi:hypothetical protein